MLKAALILSLTSCLMACGREEPPPPAEETFIGDQVKALHKAEQFEQEYLDATRERQKRIDDEVDNPSGG